MCLVVVLIAIPVAGYLWFGDLNLAVAPVFMAFYLMLGAMLDSRVI